MSGIEQPFTSDPPEHAMKFTGQITGHETGHVTPSVPMGPI